MVKLFYIGLLRAFCLGLFFYFVLTSIIMIVNGFPDNAIKTEVGIGIMICVGAIISLKLLARMVWK